MNRITLTALTTAALLSLTACKPAEETPATPATPDAPAAPETPATAPDTGSLEIPTLDGALASNTVDMRLSVSGMDCGGCAMNIKNRMTKVPGVLSADVSLEENCAYVKVTSPEVYDAIVLACNDNKFYVEKMADADTTTDEAADDSDAG